MENNEQQSNEPVLNTQHQEMAPTKKKFSINLPAAIVSAAVIIGFALVLSSPGNGLISQNGAKNTGDSQDITSVPSDVVTVRSTDHIYGNPEKASVVIYEYSDSDCPFCQQFHGTMKQILSTYGDTVAWVYRFFPLSIHPDAYNEALALQCAAEIGGNDEFFKYLDSAFSVTVDEAQSQNILISFAKAQGLDENLFKTCLGASTTKSRVDSDDAEAQKIGAQGTPFTIVVNKSGQQVVVPGAYPFENMKQIIDGLMK
jgi:protein-disulfide isomerase